MIMMGQFEFIRISKFLPSTNFCAARIYYRKVNSVKQKEKTIYNRIFNNIQAMTRWKRVRELKFAQMLCHLWYYNLSGYIWSFSHVHEIISWNPCVISALSENFFLTFRRVNGLIYDTCQIWIEQIKHQLEMKCP